MTTPDPTYPQPAALYRSPFLDGLNHIARTRRLIPAIGAQHRADADLISSHQANEHFAQHLLETLRAKGIAPGQQIVLFSFTIALPDHDILLIVVKVGHKVGPYPDIQTGLAVGSQSGSIAGLALCRDSAR